GVRNPQLAPNHDSEAKDSLTIWMTPFLWMVVVLGCRLGISNVLPLQLLIAIVKASTKGAVGRGYLCSIR
ncbi:hypothetical protein OAH34_03240, partial [bacterium]|nr:hypothetical protein [bacterium]